MHTLSVWQSLLIACWVAAVESRWLLGGATLTLRFSPLMTGLFVGVVMGDVKGAMIVTAAVQLIYMGAFAPGGTMPYEPSVAAAIAVPVALLGHTSPSAAIAVAVPVGLLGTYLYQFRFFLNSFNEKFVDKAIAEANDKKISFYTIWTPTFLTFLIFVPLVFVALYVGAPVVASFVAGLQGTLVFHVLNVLGGGLVAIGLAVTVYVIGKKQYLTFFLLAYFMDVIFTKLNITMVTYAIIGTLLAVIFVLAKGSKVNASQSVNSETEEDDDF